MRRRLIVANWKMNGSLVTNATLITTIKVNLIEPTCDIVLCVPAPYFWQCRAELAGSAISWGAQDVSAYAGGAYTGEVSVYMLRDFGCQYTIVGHSERRTYHAESDELVAQKTIRALKAGVTPIVCVGETFSEREAGQTNAVVWRQLSAVLHALDSANLTRIVVAYEPVWAIGTGKTATSKIVQNVHLTLRAKLAEKNSTAAVKIKILYGGSIKPDNIGELLAMPDIDGALIGAASLKAVDFLAILSAAR